MPLAPDSFDQLVEDVLKFWLDYELAEHDITDYRVDDEAHGLSRAMTVEDAIIGLEKQKNGQHVSEIDFGFLPPSGLDPVLVSAVKARIPDYEHVLEEREVQAARVYAEHGDRVA